VICRRYIDARVEDVKHAGQIGCRLIGRFCLTGNLLHIDESVNAFVDDSSLLSYLCSVRYVWHHNKIALEIVRGLSTTLWGRNNDFDISQRYGAGDVLESKRIDAPRSQSECDFPGGWPRVERIAPIDAVQQVAELAPE